MNLKDRLRQLDRSTTPSQPRAEPRTPVPPQDLPERLGGGWLSRHGRRIVVVRRDYPLPFDHGRVGLHPPAAIDHDALRVAARLRIREDFSLQHALFFDTETTGLAGGTGTYVFLIGVGYFEENRFVVEQLFLPELGAEPALLTYFDELLEGKRGVISFNGKSFDAPLLTSRFIQMRMAPRLDLYDHLDLLHAARRLVKQDFGDCSLGRLEERLLGLQREGDVPGEEIPGIYLDYLRFGDTERLLPVLYHNRMDILSLLALTKKLVDVVRGAEEQQIPRVHAERVAKLHLQNREPERAAKIFENLLRQPPRHREETLDHWLQLARAHKQLRRFDRAVEAWQNALSCGGFALEPLVELAKHYEHREKDPAEALTYTNRALNAVELRLQLRREDALLRAKKELLHRRERLLRKLSGK